MLSVLEFLIFPAIYFLWRSRQLKAELRSEAGSAQRAYSALWTRGNLASRESIREYGTCLQVPIGWLSRHAVSQIRSYAHSSVGDA